VQKNITDVSRNLIFDKSDKANIERVTNTIYSKPKSKYEK